MNKREIAKAFKSLSEALENIELPYYTTDNYDPAFIKKRKVSPEEFMYMGLCELGYHFKHNASRSSLTVTYNRSQKQWVVLTSWHIFSMKAHMPCKLKVHKQEGDYIYYIMPEGDFPS